MEVLMPRLAEGIEEVTILTWLAEDGETVELAQPIAEVDVEKVTVILNAEAAGVLSVVAQEGDTVPIGAVVATIG